MMKRSLFGSLKQFDQGRKSFPGEHLGTASLGLTLLRSAGRRRSLFGRLATMVAGGALLYRAASGRDGLRKLLRR